MFRWWSTFWCGKLNYRGPSDISNQTTMWVCSILKFTRFTEKKNFSLIDFYRLGKISAHKTKCFHFRNDWSEKCEWDEGIQWRPSKLIMYQSPCSRNLCFLIQLLQCWVYWRAKAWSREFQFSGSCSGSREVSIHPSLSCSIKSDFADSPLSLKSFRNALIQSHFTLFGWLLKLLLVSLNKS